MVNFSNCLTTPQWIAILSCRILVSSWRDRVILKSSHVLSRTKRKALFWTTCNLWWLVGAVSECASGLYVLAGRELYIMDFRPRSAVVKPSKVAQCALGYCSFRLFVMEKAKSVICGEAEHLVGMAPPNFMWVWEKWVEVYVSGRVAFDVNVGHDFFFWVRPNAPLQVPEAGGS